jgi:hypothetical protein
LFRRQVQLEGTKPDDGWFPGFVHGRSTRSAVEAQQAYHHPAAEVPRPPRPCRAPNSWQTGSCTLTYKPATTKQPQMAISPSGAYIGGKCSR